MPYVFKENSNNDIQTGDNNQLEIVTELQATLQACQAAMEAQQFEMIFAQNRGMPNAATVWDGNPNLQQFEFSARRVLRSVENVVSIDSFEAEIVDNTVLYQATIRTNYGIGNIQNGPV